MTVHLEEIQNMNKPINYKQNSVSVILSQSQQQQFSF